MWFVSVLVVFVGYRNVVLLMFAAFLGSICLGLILGCLQMDLFVGIETQNQFKL